jgi:uncharacterized protein
MTNKMPYQGPIYVKNSPIHGYGVFAKQDIRPEEVIEICPTLKSLLPDQKLENYYFKPKDYYYLLPMGYGCLYNHAEQPNCELYFDKEADLIIFKAIKPILKDEEVLIYYHDNWFQDRHIKIKYPSWYKRIYHFIVGPLLRGITIFIILGLIIAGVHYLGSYRFPQS